jgi:hypothetical protein
VTALQTKLIISADKIKQLHDTPYFDKIIFGFVLRTVIVHCRSITENCTNPVRANKWLRNAILNKEEAATDAII